MSNHKPATALPRLIIQRDPYPHLRAFVYEGEPSVPVLARDYEGDSAEEYVRRANAYPRLVEALKLAKEKLWNAMGGNDDADNKARADRQCEPFDTLLRELGEIT